MADGKARQETDLTLLIGGAHTRIERELARTEEERVEELKNILGPSFKAQGAVVKVWKENGRLQSKVFTDEAFE
ncbi:MAG: hypothetical protein WDN10_03630 [bacterium]